eukprot:1128704-Prymnesium_polylepis.1
MKKPRRPHTPSPAHDTPLPHPRNDPHPAAHTHRHPSHTHHPTRPRQTRTAKAMKSTSQTSATIKDVLHPDHAPPPSKTDTHFT